MLWALDHRSIDWVSRDEMGYNKAINTELFEYSDRDEFQRIILRASGDDNYPARQNGNLESQHNGSTHVRDEFVHHQYVKDNFQVQSLIDYMAVNLNTVAKDWLNYNTGWWRGIDPDGDHKKWGYIIWDMDATYGYYINYTGVPNESPNAEACDIDEISDYMDQFFGGWGGNNGFDYEDPAGCATLGTSSPYDTTDPIFNWVVNEDSACCEDDWSNSCQARYDFVAQYGTNTSEFLSEQGNIGEHEKIFLNGTLEEWESNVVDLRAFVEQRCELIGEGMECFDSITTPVADPTNFRSTIRLTQDEELIAVFSSEPVSTYETESGHTFEVFPNPASDFLMLNYELAQSSAVKVSIYNTLGSKIADVSDISGSRSAGQHNERIDLNSLGLSAGMHLVEVLANDDKAVFRVMVAK